MLLFLLATTAEAFAQTVTGTVTTAGDGSPMPGVSILLKGTSTGTATDEEGKFSLNVTDAANGVLVISFIGYATQEVAVQGRTNIDVVLAEDAAQLSEVVVTALGVQREAKTLVYATQTVKPQQLTEVRDANNILNSLSGKIANVQINQGSGGPGSGVRMVLRGNRSIQGNNSALIVVDGVPISNNSNSAATNDFGSIQSSDGASNINPDDIESITVLRGASAAALYGSQAGNGVIVITTKKGTKDKISVSINSGITAESAFTLPKVQNTYGQGNAGTIDAQVGASWGARMEGQTYTNYQGNTRTYTAQPDNIKDFFRTGISLNNSIGIQGGGEKMQTYLSYTNNKIQGIVRNNALNRHTVNLRISNQISKKLSSDAKITYISQDLVGRPRTGEENAPVINAYQLPRSMSNADASNAIETKNALGAAIPSFWPSNQSAIYQNPYWSITRNSIDELRNRIMGFVSLKYDLTKSISLTGRANLDRTVDVGSQKYANGTILWASQPGGFYAKSTTTVTQQWYDLTLQGVHNLGSEFKVDYRLGGIFQDYRYLQDDAQANGLNIVNMYNLGNAVNSQNTSTLSRTQTQSLFGQASLSFKEYLFLEVSLRNEWDSRLPSPYTILYPSVGLSGVISDMVTMPQLISFLKVNANYAMVGNGGQPQLTRNVYVVAQGAGHGLLNRRTTEAIPGLKPEKVSNIEFGFDARFLNSRVGLTFNYYKSNSRNQLLTIRGPVARGYYDKYINAGNIQNSGIEVVLNATPVKGESFTWDVTYNLGINRNKVVELDPTAPDLIFYLGGATSFSRTAAPIVKSGGSYGDMVSKKWARDASGRFIVDAGKGVPVSTTDARYIGSFNPDATMGLTNTLTYKRFSARLLVDGRVGGVIVDGTEMNLAFSGITEATAQHREGGWILGGVDAEGKAVNVPITAQQFWAAGENSVSGLRYGVGEFFAYDATNFRIRELSIGYDIPVPAHTFIKSARFSLVARNLAWLYRGSSVLDIPGLGKRKMQIDPDMSLGNGNFQGVQLATLPSTRSLGCNLNITF